MPEANLRKGTLMSHVAFFELPGYPKLLCLTDGGMCPEPTLAEKEAIGPQCGWSFSMGLATNALTWPAFAVL